MTRRQPVQQRFDFTPPRKPRPAPVEFTRQPALSSNLVDRICAGEFEGPSEPPPAPERYFCPPEFDYPGWDDEVPY